MKPTALPFIETLYHLRTIEQVILYNKTMKISDAEAKDAVAFLESEYEREALNYPFSPPIFDANAALWASKTVYFSAQLLLYRENKVSELNKFLPHYTGIINPSAILSADICLRFLPQIRDELKRIDSEDAILPILERNLQQFHYSAVGFDLDVKTNDLKTIFSNDCLKQLYLDRIVARKDYKLAEQPEINACLLANFGDYKKEFWNELKTIDIEIQ
jgi:hypothetical protein